MPWIKNTLCMLVPYSKYFMHIINTFICLRRHRAIEKPAASDGFLVEGDKGRRRSGFPRGQRLENALIGKGTELLYDSSLQLRRDRCHGRENSFVSDLSVLLASTWKSTLVYLGKEWRVEVLFATRNSMYDE